MFATTPGYVHRESFRGLLDAARVVPAQPRCIFGNGDDAESSHSGARPERVCWTIFSWPSFREAVVACVSQGPVGPGSPKEAEEISALATSVFCACGTASRYSGRAGSRARCVQFSSPPGVSAQLVRTGHLAREWVSGVATRPGAAGDLRQPPRGSPGSPNATRARRAGALREILTRH